METVGQGNYSVLGQVVLVAEHLFRKDQFRSSKHGVGGGLLIHEGWFDSNDRSHFQQQR